MEKRTYQAPDFEMERFAKDEMAGADDSPTGGVNTPLDEVDSVENPKS